MELPFASGDAKNAVIHELAREVTFNEVRVGQLREAFHRFFVSIATYVRMVNEHGGYSLSTRGHHLTVESHPHIDRADVRRSLDLMTIKFYMI